MLADRQGVRHLAGLAQRRGQDEGFVRRRQVRAPVGHRLLGPAEPHQHRHVARGLPLHAGQVEKLVEAPPALQDVEPGDGQRVRVERLAVDI